MSRCRILYDRHGMLAEYQDGELIWCRDGGMDEAESGPQVVRDLAPYQSMITGEVIDGRKRHRDHLKAHGCVEVGNDTSHLTQRPKITNNRRESLHRMLADVGDREIRRIVQTELRNRR
jgi:hypothetical protein